MLVSVRAYNPPTPKHICHIENDTRRVVWHCFLYFKIFVSFTANGHGLDSYLHLSAKVLELFLDIICRLLVLELYDHSNNVSFT